MESLIFVVEDEPKTLYFIKRILEKNDFKVLTAENGQEALEILTKTEELPDLIISDINMPKMNGYDFFKTVSEIPRLNNIPFIFLSALDSPEDIRLGKMLGVDDYLTKPVEFEDLLAIIAGKLARNRIINQVNQKIKDIITPEEPQETVTVIKEEEIVLMTVFWDDIFGPKLNDSCPKNKKFPFSIEQVGSQLYQAASSIYGDEHFKKAEGILLSVRNIQRNGYLFFDSYPDETFRGGEREYMIAVIAPIISYRNSLELKQVLANLSEKVKQKEEYNLEKYWKEVVNLIIQ